VRTASQQLNLLGRPARHYDEAGLLILQSYDFKGNLLEKSRQVIADSQILSVFASGAANNWQIQPYRLDWQPPAGTALDDYAGNLLDPLIYQTSIAYDALNRVKNMVYPQDVSGVRRELRPKYNRAGALESVQMDTAPFVERIAYNAKAQRVLISYGNGVMTRYSYDSKTFRLARMRTEPYTAPVSLTYSPGRGVLQDYAYTYDLAGNILSIQDRTPGCGVLNNPDSVQVSDAQLAQLLVSGDALIRKFEYDPQQLTADLLRRFGTRLHSRHLKLVERLTEIYSRCGFEELR